ncbi:pentatricopeptide repeat-containing protein At4g31850, chloroplastic [Euphorbia lathyris]|uniref:pentatricopeptide repeat-containing protein At4g31850, chloroplastic n=1 Tax=Euphorbia lathyris TaxID=212925 RepID=UPI0033136295
MSLKLLLNRQTVYHISRFNGRLLCPYTFYMYRDFSTVTASASGPIYSASIYDRTALQNPKFLNHNCSFKRYLYSSQHRNKNELRIVPKSNSSDSGEEDGTMTEFLSRFVQSMRGKLSVVYSNLDKKTIDSMLLIIVAKVASGIENDSLEQMRSASMSTPSEDFSEELWRTVWEVSYSVLDDMEKEKKKEKMKGFLQSDEVKEMCRFAGEIGIRGDMLRELRFKWAHEKMEESEFYASLEGFKEELKSMEKEEADDMNAKNFGETDIASEEEEKVISLPRRHGKIKYKIYGLDLSDPKWAEVAEKIHETGEIIWPQEAKPIHGKTKLVTEKILSLKEEDDPSQLLAEWVELLQPSRIDWMALLDKLKEQNRHIFYKVGEYLLKEKPFQPSLLDYSMLIDAYANEDRVEDAERVVKKMNEDGIFPDILTATILVQMYCKAGNVQRAKEAYEILRSHGIQPDMKVYTSMLLTYVNAGDPKSCELLIREMQTRDIKPTEEIYTALLRSFAQCDDVAGVNRIANVMQLAGFKPSMESCSLLVEGHARLGDIEQARANLDYMIRNGHVPDDKTTACMIAAYERKNLLDKALELLLKLEQDGFEPGPATYTVIVDWLGKLGLIDEAEQLLGKIAEQGEAPPFEIQVSLCDMYARAGNEKKALQALGILESKKEQLNFNDFDRVIRGLLEGGFLQDAKRVHELMQQDFATSMRLKHKDELERLEMSLRSAQGFGRRPKNS